MPTRVSYNTPSSGNHSTSTTPKTTNTFDVQAGDLIVVKALQAASPALAGGVTSTPSASGGSVTWTERVDNSQDGQYRAVVGVWTGTVGATATGITVTLAQLQAQTSAYGFSATVWRDHGGVGAVFNAYNGGVVLAQVSATCSASSAIDGIVGDSWGSEGIGRTWCTINGTAITEAFYHYPIYAPTVYEGYHLDVGSAGSKTYGFVNPNMQYSIGAVEILAGGAGPVTLTPADTAHVHTTDSPSLTQAHTLAPVDSAHALSADATALTQVHALAPLDTFHASSTTSPTLTGGSTLQPDDSAYGHATESPTLAQVHVLAPVDARHGHSADSPALTQTHTLAPVDTLHRHTADTSIVTTYEPANATPARRTITIPAENRTLTIPAQVRTITP